MISLCVTYFSIMIISSNKKQNYVPQFKARKIAVARPIVDGIKKEIEIYQISAKDKKTFDKIVQNTNIAHLLPSKILEPNFIVWQRLLEITRDCIGEFSHQKIFLALHDNKPCGVLLAQANRKKAEVITFVTWPTAVEQKVKKAGSALFTALLNFANKKKIKQVNLEPIVNGPTDAVGFYKSHGMDFPDKYASKMTAWRSKITETAQKKSEELNYTVLKHPIKVNLNNRINFNEN